MDWKEERRKNHRQAMAMMIGVIVILLGLILFIRLR